MIRKNILKLFSFNQKKSFYVRIYIKEHKMIFVLGRKPL